MKYIVSNRLRSTNPYLKYLLDYTSQTNILQIIRDVYAPSFMGHPINIVL